MASTVCVLYGEKRKIRPPLWEILHGNGDQQQINGMIFLKVEDWEYNLKIESKIKDFRKRKLKISRAKIKADLFGNEIHWILEMI